MICAFPYVIAFTNESMEIRLLVNGNLVHMATMAELKLVTNKKDIFFTTTAPEFIPRSSRIKGLEYDDSTTTMTAANGDANNSQKVYPKINDISDEKILEIKSKIERIEAKTTTTTSDSVESSESQESQDEYHCPQNGAVINQKDDLNRLMVGDDLPSIQRARSLQGKDNKQKDSLEEKRRQISKSNSCGESTIVTNGVVTPTSSSAAHIKAQEPVVPPNSPKVKEGGTFHGSPNAKSKQNSSSDGSSPGKVKPLRIYRIPLSNLIGTSHHHHHTHHSNNLHNNFTNPTKIQSSKIAEDHSEDAENGNRSSKGDEML